MLPAVIKAPPSVLTLSWEKQTLEWLCFVSIHSGLLLLPYVHTYMSVYINTHTHTESRVQPQVSFLGCYLPYYLPSTPTVLDKVSLWPEAF